jgi:hypothetical protein
MSFDRFSVDDTFGFLMFSSLGNQQESSQSVVKRQSYALSCIASGVLLTSRFVGCVLR